jgi:hypothetical protein
VSAELFIRWGGLQSLQSQAISRPESADLAPDALSGVVLSALMSWVAGPVLFHTTASAAVDAHVGKAFALIGLL